MSIRLIAAIAITAILPAACSRSAAEPEPVPMPDWSAAIDATRDVNPTSLTVEALLEVDEEPAGGNGFAGVVDWDATLGDVTLFDPLSDTALSRVILNGDTGYVLSSADPFLDALDGAEILRAPLDELTGLVSFDPEVATGLLGLLRGTTATTAGVGGAIDVTIDLDAALAAMTPAELEGFGLDLDDVVEPITTGDVLLSDHGTIDRFRVRIEGTREDLELLVNGLFEHEPVETELTFEPPPEDRVADLADVPEVRSLLTR
jgi:hypothetical protein